MWGSRIHEIYPLLPAEPRSQIRDLYPFCDPRSTRGNLFQNWVDRISREKESRLKFELEYARRAERALEQHQKELEYAAKFPTMEQLLDLRAYVTAQLEHVERKIQSLQATGDAVAQLSSDALFSIFRHLDHDSLNVCAKVCLRWMDVIRRHAENLYVQQTPEFSVEYLEYFTERSPPDWFTMRHLFKLTSRTKIFCGLLSLAPTDQRIQQLLDSLDRELQQLEKGLTLKFSKLSKKGHQSEQPFAVTTELESKNIVFDVHFLVTDTNPLAACDTFTISDVKSLDELVAKPVTAVRFQAENFQIHVEVS
uniref:F-box domain-containing protein n=1 Tax=viral metagenome TaxID=1070528 RepID=A0A6C0BLX2_9ZZZZ